MVKHGEVATCTVHLPRQRVSPLRSVLRRVALALLALFGVFLTVVVDRDGYRDSIDGTVSLLDAAYYATVTASTTGYGDIVPATPVARLMNIVIVTPLRIVFLVILVGTTLEVLTQRTREQWRESRWRSSMHDHTIVVGYGTKGRSAIATLIANGRPPEHIVVVDRQREMIAEANAAGLVGVVGDATRTAVLTRAEIAVAREVVVAVDRDDAAVLVTLTARQLNTTATIAAAVRESENAPLLRQSGATSVVTSSEAAGRLLGVATASPAVSELLTDLLQIGQGLDLIERPVTAAEVGRSPLKSDDRTLAVVRDGHLLRYDDVSTLIEDDRLVVVRRRAPVG